VINTGAIVLRAAPPGEMITYVITGIGRSGTSMAAGLLRNLGIYMGETRDEAVNEDKEIRDALMYFFHGSRARIIERRNAEHQKWGLKFPSLMNHLHPPELEQFRNPRLIVMVRDAVAVTRRSLLSDTNSGHSAAVFGHVIEQQTAMTAFVLNAKCPALLLSYEKFLAFPKTNLNMLAAFCGLSLSDDARRDAISGIIANNPDYISLFAEGHS
jgi:hypothetical protein